MIWTSSSKPPLIGKENRPMARIIDISLPISDRYPAWPGESRPVLSKVHAISEGADANVSKLEMGVHFGTHVDAPHHFIDGAKTVEELDLNILNGPVMVVEFPEVSRVTAKMLVEADIPEETERLILKTRNSGFWDCPESGFVEDFTALDQSAAEWLVAAKIGLVGIDYLSIEGFIAPGAPVHKTLLSAGIVALEGLDLRNVMPGKYDLHCLPLKIPGADGAPARAILIQNESPRRSG